MRFQACLYAPLAGFLALLVWGCDAQAAREYRGESLLTLLGTVEIPEPRATGPLVPALMFPGSGSTFQLVDVTVKGEFPSDFRIDIYEPPLGDVLESVPFLDEPAAALGYITAVPADHPERLRFATHASATATAGCDSPGCQTPCEAVGRCVSAKTWCADDGECYRETRTCPKQASPDADCTIEHEGDPQLKLEPWQAFAGFSQNYMVAYLSGEASAQSYLALAFGAHEKLSAGYHLLAVRAPTDEERAESAACEKHAEDIALARTNERRGTDYRADELKGYPCSDPGSCAEGFACELPEDLEPQSRLCHMSDAARDELEDLFERALIEATLDFRCPPSRWVLTHVPDPERERISVRLAPDANPWERSI